MLFLKPGRMTSAPRSIEIPCDLLIQLYCFSELAGISSGCETGVPDLLKVACPLPTQADSLAPSPARLRSAASFPLRQDFAWGENPSAKQRIARTLRGFLEGPERRIFVTRPALV